MRTTVDIPDELYRSLKLRAASSGLKLRELMTRYLEGGLATMEERAKGQSGPIPVQLPRTGGAVGALSAAALRDMETEDDVERHARPA